MARLQLPETIRDVIRRRRRRVSEALQGPDWADVTFNPRLGAVLAPVASPAPSGGSDWAEVVFARPPRPSGLGWSAAWRSPVEAYREAALRTLAPLVRPSPSQLAPQPQGPQNLVAPQQYRSFQGFGLDVERLWRDPVYAAAREAEARANLVSTQTAAEAALLALRNATPAQLSSPEFMATVRALAAEGGLVL